MEYVVDCRWDDEAGVWIAVCDAIPLALESNSLDALMEKVKTCAGEILALNAPMSPTEICIKSELRENLHCSDLTFRSKALSG